MIPSSKTSAWAARLQTAQAGSRSPTPRGRQGALCLGPTLCSPGPAGHRTARQQRAWSRREPLLAPLAPQPPCALSHSSSAHRRRGAACGGGPSPSQCSGAPLRQLCPVSVRTPSLRSNFGYSEALGIDVADTGESESTLGSGCSLTATVTPDRQLLPQ